jgi:hypothetical protein
MPQREDGEVVESVEDDEEIVHSNGTESRLARLEEAQGNNQAKEALTRLMSDPDIQAVYKAKTSGKKVKVVDDVEEPEADPAEALIKDMPEDDPQKDLLGKISQLIDAKLEKSNKRFEDVESRLSETADVARAVKTEKITNAVKAAREKFKDFDQFKDKMLSLSEENPGLGVEDLYYVAKARSGKLRQVETVTESEKPSSQPRRVAKPGSAPKRAPGRAGFSDILRDSFERTSFEGADQL